MKRLKKQKRKKKQTRNLISVQGVAIEDDLHTPCLFSAREVRFEKGYLPFVGTAVKMCAYSCVSAVLGLFKKGKMQ